MSTTTATVSVKIPTALRPQTGGHEALDIAGGNIREVLAALSAPFPDLGERLFKSANEINRFINIYVNDEDIRFTGNLDTAVKAGDEVSIVPAIAGG